MKYIMNKILVMFLVLSIGLVGVGYSIEDDYGHFAIEDEKTYTLEEMLKYAIEDEYLAKAEYELIINELDGERPFTNIYKAELRHIEAIERLYENHDIEIIEIDPSNYELLPESIDKALEVGIQAEIDNIKMYDIFLEQELPDDVKTTFEALKRGSENHLDAFKRASSGNNGNSGKNSKRQKGINGNRQRKFK